MWIVLKLQQSISRCLLQGVLYFSGIMSRPLGTDRNGLPAILILPVTIHAIEELGILLFTVSMSYLSVFAK